MKVTSIYVAGILLLISCNNSDTPDRDKSLSTGHDTLQSAGSATATSPNTVTINSGQATTQPVQVNPQQVQVNPQQVQVNPQQSNVQGVTMTSQPVTAAKSQAGLNPAHGQPGHRCDIPVGAPLNSPPGKAATAPQASITQSPAQTATINQSPVQTANIKTAPGMNPPHGQPGHRCDIPVGQPLNSKPGVVQAPVIAPAQPVIKPVPGAASETAETVGRDSSKH